jgi:hypothetical protein
MDASQNPPRALLDTACRSRPPTAAAAAGHGDLVIENFAEFAAAGLPGICGICIADYVTHTSVPKASA